MRLKLSALMSAFHPLQTLAAELTSTDGPRVSRTARASRYRVYSSAAAARAAIERLQQRQGFCDYPDCFTIDAYEVDEDHWTEGFVIG